MPDSYPTIQAAVDAAKPGDLVLVKPGTYHEAVNVTTDNLTIRGTDRNSVVLDGKFERIVDAIDAGGSGDIIFRRDAWRDSDGDRRANEIGFFAIPNVRDVELLLQKLGQTAKH